MAKVVDDPLYVGADSVALLSIDNSFGAGLADAQREARTPRSSLKFGTTRRRSRSTTRLRTCSDERCRHLHRSLRAGAGHPRCIQPIGVRCSVGVVCRAVGRGLPSTSTAPRTARPRCRGRTRCIGRTRPPTPRRPAAVPRPLVHARVLTACAAERPVKPRPASPRPFGRLPAGLDTLSPSATSTGFGPSSTPAAN